MGSLDIISSPILDLEYKTSSQSQRFNAFELTLQFALHANHTENKLQLVSIIHTKALASNLLTSISNSVRWKWAKDKTTYARDETAEFTLRLSWSHGILLNSTELLLVEQTRKSTPLWQSSFLIGENFVGLLHIRIFTPDTWYSDFHPT